MLKEQQGNSVSVTPHLIHLIHSFLFASAHRASFLACQIKKLSMDLNGSDRLRPVTKPAEKPQVLAAARIMLTRISRSLVNKRQSLNGHRQSRTGFWIEVAW